MRPAEGPATTLDIPADLAFAGEAWCWLEDAMPLVAVDSTLQPHVLADLLQHACTLWSLNHVAVANISQFGGRFRDEPIYVGTHKPPHFKDVADLMDRYFSFVHENWHIDHPTWLAAYVLWRLCWVHPFIEGNGRTARAACYYILCVKNGGLLSGKKIVPERIRENREPYYEALRAADRYWHEGHLDVTSLADYLSGLLEAQLKDED